MSKDIVIKEGAAQTSLSSVGMIRTSVLGGGIANWVPEDETKVGEITITQNGEYVPFSDGLYGYWKVNVIVPGGAGAEIESTVYTPSSNATSQDSSNGSVVITSDEQGPPSNQVSTAEYIEPEPSSTSPVGCSGGSVYGFADDGNEYYIESMGEEGISYTMMPASMQMVSPLENSDYEQGDTIDYTGAEIRMYGANGDIVYWGDNEESILSYDDGDWDAIGIRYPTTADFTNGYMLGGVLMADMTLSWNRVGDGMELTDVFSIAQA